MRHIKVDIDRIETKRLYEPRMARVVGIRQWTELEKLFVLEFEDGRSLGHQPGQFVEVSVYGIGGAPISVSSAPSDDAQFEICVRRVGNVTNALHKLRVGDVVGIRGPYGRGFPVKELEGKDLLFIGGGIGMIPLRSFINYAIQNKDRYGKLTILYGCKRPHEFLFREEIRSWSESADYRDTVDAVDGEDWPLDVPWKRKTGVITVLIPDLEINPDTTYAVVVGPPIMYRFVIRELKKKNLPDDRIIVSLERRMKCGVGKCGHCQIGPLYVCQDGPVFYYSEIKDIKEAL